MNPKTLDRHQLEYINMPGSCLVEAGWVERHAHDVMRLGRVDVEPGHSKALRVLEPVPEVRALREQRRHARCHVTCGNYIRLKCNKTLSTFEKGGHQCQQQAPSKL